MNATRTPRIFSDIEWKYIGSTFQEIVDPAKRSEEDVGRECSRIIPPVRRFIIIEEETRDGRDGNLPGRDGNGNGNSTTSDSGKAGEQLWGSAA
jgi:hypothetical protein